MSATDQLGLELMLELLLLTLLDTDTDDCGLCWDMIEEAGDWFCDTDDTDGAEADTDDDDDEGDGTIEADDGG